MHARLQKRVDCRTAKLSFALKDKIYRQVAIAFRKAHVCRGSQRPHFARATDFLRLVAAVQQPFLFELLKMQTHSHRGQGKLARQSCC